jgi:hypothetical protein
MSDQYYECDRRFGEKDCFKLCNNSWDFKYEKKNNFHYNLYCKCTYDDKVICDKFDVFGTGAIALLGFSIVFTIIVFFIIINRCFPGKIQDTVAKNNTVEKPPAYTETVI